MELSPNQISLDEENDSDRMVDEMDILKENTDVIRLELNWFDEVLNVRLKLYFGHECNVASIWDILPPDYEGKKSYYAEFIRHYKCTAAERLILMLALAPHARPQLLDVFTIKNATYDKGFTEFGGLKGSFTAAFCQRVKQQFFCLVETISIHAWP